MRNPNELLTQIESARLWNYFHKDWLLQIRQSLREQLPGQYRVFVESEAVLISPEFGEVAATVLPDVAVSRAGSEPLLVTTTRSASATAAVIEAEEPCDIETHYSLVIRRAPEHFIVAALELPSPSNKGSGNRLDEQQHLHKREEYLNARIRLMEIDALLEGRRTLPDRLVRLAEYERIAWTAFYEAGRRRYRGWSWNQSEPLPRLDWQVDTDHEVEIDLARTLDQAVEFNDWDHFPVRM